MIHYHGNVGGSHDIAVYAPDGIPSRGMSHGKFARFGYPN